VFFVVYVEKGRDIVEREDSKRMQDDLGLGLNFNPTHTFQFSNSHFFFNYLSITLFTHKKHTPKM
jgi:hypothetical protein